MWHNFVQNKIGSITIMEHSIPTNLWKSQLLKLVNEAPKAVVVKCSVSSHHRLFVPPSCSSYSTSSSGNSDECNVKEEASCNIKTDHNEQLRLGEKSSSLHSIVAITRRKGSIKTAAAPWARPSVYTFNPFGCAFHGYLRGAEAQALLQEDGQFLVRKRERDGEDEFVLSFKFKGHLKSYLITYDDNSGLIYIGEREKGYVGLEELVQEGLITMYLDTEAGPYIDLMCDLTRHNGRSGSYQQRLNSGGSLSSLGRKGSPASESKNQTPSPSASIERRRGRLNSHSFDVHTFKELSKCQICRNFLWGLSAQGLLCKDCGLCIHSGCSDKALLECEPQLRKLVSLFGTDLKILVKASGGDRPPCILTKCVQEIEKRGMHIEGIYRVSGSKELTERLRIAFDNDRQNTDLSSHQDIHSMCSLVKMFLRELPTPLISSEFFMKFTERDSIRIEDIRKELKKTQGAQYITLKYLLQHLHRVAEQSERNKMNPFNLSSVFAPSVMCPSLLTLETLKTATCLLELMITQVPNLFPPV